MRKNDPVILHVPFEVVCINDKNKPFEIPQSKWIKEGQKYTVVGVGNTLDGKVGFKLESPVLDESCEPFDCFNPARFGIPVEEQKDALMQELEELGIQVEEFERELKPVNAR